MQTRIVSYNIHKGIGVDRRFRLERIAEVLGHHDADIVLLQEVDQGAPRSKGLDLARELADRLGYRWHVLGLNVRLKQGRYGNAILSRFPIASSRNIDLSLEESWIRRGCQHVTLELGSRRRLDVFNVHLGLSARERERQVELLARSSEYLRVPPESPAIVGGDFNDWRSLLVPQMTNGLGFHWATQAAETSRFRRAIPTYPSFSPQGGLDRFYYRGRLRLSSVHACRLKLSRVASDHLPMVANFMLD